MTWNNLPHVAQKLQLFIHSYVWIFNKVYESSASTFVIRMISDKFKRSENVLTRLFCNKRMDACVIAVFKSVRWLRANCQFLVAFNRFVDFVIVARLKEFSHCLACPWEIFLPVEDNRWLVKVIKDMFKLKLLLNDIPVFHENLFEIRCGRIVGIVGSNKP